MPKLIQMLIDQYDQNHENGVFTNDSIFTLIKIGRNIVRFLNSENINNKTFFMAPKYDDLQSVFSISNLDNVTAEINSIKNGTGPAMVRDSNIDALKNALPRIIQFVNEDIQVYFKNQPITELPFSQLAKDLIAEYSTLASQVGGLPNVKTTAVDVFLGVSTSIKHVLDLCVYLVKCEETPSQHKILLSEFLSKAVTVFGNEYISGKISERIFSLNCKN